MWMYVFGGSGFLSSESDTRGESGALVSASTDTASQRVALSEADRAELE